MLSLHKLFKNDGNPTSLDEVITPSAAQKRALMDAKNDIRDHLRKTIREATVSVLGMPHMVTPRFRTQGSWAYKTCIKGAHLPPQEMDWDFGVYLPVTAWEDTSPPRAMARLYFEFVERSLADLCEQKGWVQDKSNKRCARVKISDWGHVDLPLYAAPEDKFRNVAEKSAMDSSMKRTNHLRENASLEEFSEKGEMPNDFWVLMDEIHVAKRDGTWQKSDPEQVANWFDDRVTEHTDQLRRVCRYLKAWRDYNWESGGPTSVLIMIIVSKSFQAIRGRDDLALENAAADLAKRLAEDVREVGIDLGVEDFNRLSPSDRIVASQKARELQQAIYTSRHYGPGLVGKAIANMQTYFGTRISNDASLVVVDNAAEVRSTDAARVAAPAVGATKAGWRAK